MRDSDPDDAPKPFGATVAGYPYFGGDRMDDYLPRERARLAAWRAATAQKQDVDSSDLERLTRERRERAARLRKGETEGPPNPYLPHRRR